MSNIVEIAVADGRFSTLVAALKATNLVETLSGKGPFTVFAPTDDAFALLPAGAVEALLADTPKLTRILTYHVIAGSAPAAVVAGAPAHTTVEGGEIKITHDNDRVLVNDATIVAADIEASNGYIHVIDHVLMPE